MDRYIGIAGRRWAIAGSDNDSYVENLADPFEPHLVSMLAVMCDRGAQVLDIGANNGCTAIALSQIVDNGKVVAFEPVPRTFNCLSKNVSELPNVSIHNYALGSKPGVLPMQGAESNSGGAFIANEFHISNDKHFQVDVPVCTLDEVFPSLELDRVDFVKIDVEGFELDVFEGARETLQRFKPRVVLELNHFCLNMFRRITYPEFRERLLRVFPYVYAIEGSEYRDLTDDKEAYAVGYEHVVNFRYANLVAGFDKTDLLARLATLDRARHIVDEAARVAAEAANQLRVQREELAVLQGRLASSDAEMNHLRRQLLDSTARQRELESEKAELLTSSSWRVTSPLRSLKRIFQ